MEIKRNFEIYGDNWFEIQNFFESITMYFNSHNIKKWNIKTVCKNIKHYVYSLKFEIENKKYELIFDTYGKFNNYKNHEIVEMLENGGKPDLVFLENGKIILGVEDTETAQVGNSALQRMDRIDFFIRRKIPFLYTTYFISYDRSQEKIKERKCSATQLYFFEKNNVDILYKWDQDDNKNEDKLLISKYFFSKILNFNIDFNNQKIIKEKIKQEKIYKDLILFLNHNKEMNFDDYEWKPNFINDSPILENLYKNKKIFTFTNNKKNQKIGFTHYYDLKKVLNNFNLDINGNCKNDDIILITPVMFTSKKNNKIVCKCDPATGEFVYYNNLFNNFKNLVLIYSPTATKEIIKKNKSKLTKHIKEKADFILLSNYLKNEFICNHELKIPIIKHSDKYDENDLVFAFYNYMKTQNFLPLYISAPGGSWNKITYNGEKIIDISKVENRPDFIFINENEKKIIIGEAKIKLADLKNNKKKHEETFFEFKTKLKNISSLFQDFKIESLNICYWEKNNELLDFELSMLLLDEDKNQQYKFIKNQISKKT